MKWSSEEAKRGGKMERLWVLAEAKFASPSDAAKKRLREDLNAEELTFLALSIERAPSFPAFEALIREAVRRKEKGEPEALPWL